MLNPIIVAEHLNLLTIVLRSGDEPVLSRVQMFRVAQAHRAHAQYLKQRANLEDSDDDDGPQDDDAWLYEDLKILANLYSRLRDREQLIALVFEVRCFCFLLHDDPYPSVTFGRDSRPTFSKISSLSSTHR